MIEGLKVTIVGTEVAQICRQRADFHEGRSKFYASQKEALPDLSEAQTHSNTYKQPHEMMQERIALHTRQAAELRFIADHIEPAEKYLLSGIDLEKLGITSRC